MPSKDFLECLKDVYHGEQTGEIFFDAMLEKADSPEQQYIVGSFLQFETEGKALIRPAMSRFGLSMVEDRQARETVSAGKETLFAMSWEESFAAINETTRSTYLQRYVELETLVCAEEEPETAKLAKFMGDHERALVLATENILNDSENPMEPIVSLLHFPLFRPA
ncbi:hypothetical protein GCM10009096_19030 [Parasphingorhabdus litoris]|uniref:Uncharacterized protein n=1 Tax=Parasphingorhabdus litoris TaxID=394733 RepID=A0ABN1AII2_9SPHN|nr:hypothetical protein [Parasphingorhabdus litoris]